MSDESERAAAPWRLQAWTAGVLVLLPWLFCGYTGQVWEDFLITWRHSANLAAGAGLGYYPHEPLHGFTSPVNVLLPALFAWATGAASYAVPHLLYTCVAVAALAAGGVVAVRTLWAAVSAEARAGLWLFAPWLALCVKVTAFTVNGQEAGFWVAGLALAYAAAVRGHAAAWLPAGCGWGLLLWTRPDSPVHIAVLGLGAWALARGARRAEFLGLVRAAAVCTAVYLPWFAWAWWYFGTPVPHTVLAKAGAYGGVVWNADPAWLAGLVAGWLALPFLPVYAEAGGWPVWLTGSLAVLGGLALLALAKPGRAARLAGIGLLGSLAYLVFLDLRDFVFPWYGVPPAFFAAVALAQTPWSRGEGRPGVGARVVVPAVGLALLACAFAGSLVQLRAQQRLVEDGVRTVVGRVLAEHVRPGERVLLEPIGYIGYHANVRLLDYPGLVSPEVVAARRGQVRGLVPLIGILRPEWIVLRPAERSVLLEAGFLRDYRDFAAVSRQREIDAVAFLPGRDFLLSDAAFHILRRADLPPAP